MGLIFEILRRLIKISIYTTIFVAFIVFIPNLPPYTKFTSIPLEPPQPRVGPLAPNEALNNAQRVYVDKLLGPEAFQLYKGELYTSLATGEIVKISSGGHVTFVTKLGQPCTGLSQEHICGRPLGFQIDEKTNAMYVADAYHGIWRVDLKNDKKQLLVSPRVSIEGRMPKLFNSIALSRRGDLYWTDSTSDYHLKDGAMSSLSDLSGRLFQYNPANNQSKVLLDDLWFPNGVVISPDNQFVVFAETFRFRLIKYYIDGPKKGKSEVLAAGLPGSPDNVRALPDGSGLLVALYVTYDDENPLLIRPLAGTPLARKLLARVQRLIEIPFEYLNTIYPHVLFEDIVYHIGHFKTISDALPKQTGLVVVDWNGNIVESYYNTDGSISHISDAIVYNNRLYTGAPHAQNYIGSVPVPPLLKKAFEAKADAAPKQQAKPKEEVKSKVEAKPDVKREAPKPVVQEKPAAQKQVKPVETAKPPPPPPAQKPAPKPVEQPKPAASKPVEQPKPAAPKPVEAPKPAAPKPVEAPKPAAPKPVEATKQAPQKPAPPKPEPVKTPSQPKPGKPTPKPEAKASPTPKATAKPTVQTPPAKKTETKTTPKPAKAKPIEPEPEFIVTRPKEEALNEIKNKLAPENIPIKEEIPSDTAKPNKETLKVIRKDGPAEIPNPHQ